jgi:hypothetical protein
VPVASQTTALTLSRGISSFGSIPNISEEIYTHFSGYISHHIARALVADAELALLRAIADHVFKPIDIAGSAPGATGTGRRRIVIVLIGPRPHPWATCALRFLLRLRRWHAKNRPTECCVGGPFVANGWLELLLFRGIALSSAPRLTSHLASVAPRLTSFVATGAPRLTSFVATCAPRLTPVHTGRCWSCGRWSGCLCLSLSI